MDFIHLYVIVIRNMGFFFFRLQVVASHSGQWCFGVLLNLPVTWWFGPCTRLQQLRTFGRAHSSQPHPWHSLRRHSSCECLSPAPYLICIPAFTVACVPLRAAQGAAVRWALLARLIRRRAVQRMFLHRWSRLCPHTHSMWAGHLLILQTVRGLQLCCTYTTSSSFQKKKQYLDEKSSVYLKGGFFFFF